MQIELWGEWLYLEGPQRWEAYLLLALYATGLVALLLRRRRDFATLRGRRLLFFLLLLPFTALLNIAPRLRLSAADILSSPGQAIEPIVPALPLLGLLTVAAGAAWTEVAPAALLGLLAGFLRAGATTHSLLDPFSLAFQAALVSYSLRQNYRGRLAWLARQPLVALIVANVLVQPLNMLSAFFLSYRTGGALAALDYSSTWLAAVAPLGLAEAAVYGLLLQCVYLIRRLRPVITPLRSPPYGRTLNRRLQSIFIPLFLVMIVVLVYAVSATATDIATRQAVDALMRDARNGADGLWQFVSIGQSLIRQFAGESELWSGDEAACQTRLQSSLQMLPYFSRLTAYDADGQVLCTYPAPTAGETELTAAEAELMTVVMETGGLQTTRVHRGLGGRAILSFIGPLEAHQDGERYGTLVGRVEIDLSPLLAQVLTGLQWTMQQGEGFVVDADGRIVMHPDPTRLLEPWEIDESRPPIETLPNDQGWVRESRDPSTNARQLAGYVRVEGYPWAVVILLPHQVVLGQATRIAGPLLVLLTVLTAAVGVIIPLATNQLTRPLELLARGAERIAAGDLEQPVVVTGDDEVAQVGSAFEKMRVGLKDRLDDLSLLLQVAQEVSAKLDIAQGMPRLLEGALQATGGRVSRIVLLSAAGDPQVVMGRGEAMDGLGTLDRALTAAAREVEEPVLIENLRRARTIVESGPLPEGIQAVVALPVRSKGRPVAVMWTGFAEPKRPEPSAVNVLSTLAGQAAVLIENARLFQLAEGGRRRLAAILSSTGDAVLVTDRDDRMLLMNPAAERALALTADDWVGRRLSEVPLEAELMRIFTGPLGRAGPLVAEVPLPNGRVFYASASIILSSEGENMGRVVVMRDITHFKELDEMKSEFVATVSHDLRAPLTFMRGYATMLPMVGEMNPKQQEYLEKILVGIEQMSRLIEDLLNLGRIEAGVGLEEKSCHIGAIVVEAVDGLRARAAAKGLTLRMEASEPAPVIVGDSTLLRQAVANLVENAVKYTPAGGSVTVGLRTIGREVLVVVSDNGIGIAPEDQVRLFEKFYRIRRRDVEETPGSGLGLAIVKSIVERHGGRVWVESEMNRGSTFTIALPVRTPSEIPLQSVGEP